MSTVTSNPVTKAPADLPGSETKKETQVLGYVILARALRRLQNVKSLFFLLGGPMTDAEVACRDEGIQMIDVRHEQAAALMAQAYARVLGQPGVCMACSGPGTINLTTGVANALVDCVPLVALGGSSPVNLNGKGSFQEIDQVAIMRPVTKWAERVYDARRIPELLAQAFREATSGKPGPVYLDFPGDVLYQRVNESEIPWGMPPDDQRVEKAGATPRALERAVAMLREAKQPIIFSGSGILFSHASAALQKFVEETGIPFYTTPQGRGVIPEDHEYFYGAARTTALKEADLVLVVGTRLNYVVGYGKPPRFSKSAKWIRIDIDPEEINNSERIQLGIVGDAKTVLEQLSTALKGQASPNAYAPWRDRLGKLEAERRVRDEERLGNNQTPIHPLRLCKEIRDFLDRDAILAVDGHEILSFARQSIPSFVPGHRINSGPFGMMGVGMPFGVGAKVASPDKQVLVLHGDGSFGMNGMELDTAVRHKLPIIVVISLNGGWTADPDGEKCGSRLGYTRFDKMFESIGCHGEFVEDPAEIRPALERAGRAAKNGQCAVVNVVTDSRALFQGVKHSEFRT